MKTQKLTITYSVALDNCFILHETEDKNPVFILGNRIVSIGAVIGVFGENESDSIRYFVFAADNKALQSTIVKSVTKSSAAKIASFKTEIFVPEEYADSRKAFAYVGFMCIKENELVFFNNAATTIEAREYEKTAFSGNPIYKEIENFEEIEVFYEFFSINSFDERVKELSVIKETKAVEEKQLFASEEELAEIAKKELHSKILDLCMKIESEDFHFSKIENTNGTSESHLLSNDANTEVCIKNVDHGVEVSVSDEYGNRKMRFTDFYAEKITDFVSRKNSKTVKKKEAKEEIEENSGKFDSIDEEGEENDEELDF